MVCKSLSGPGVRCGSRLREAWSDGLGYETGTIRSRNGIGCWKLDLLEAGNNLEEAVACLEKVPDCILAMEKCSVGGDATQLSDDCFCLKEKRRKKGGGTRE